MGSLCTAANSINTQKILVENNSDTVVGQVGDENR